MNRTLLYPGVTNWYLHTFGTTQLREFRRDYSNYRHKWVQKQTAEETVIIYMYEGRQGLVLRAMRAGDRAGGKLRSAITGELIEVVVLFIRIKKS